MLERRADRLPVFSVDGISLDVLILEDRPADAELLLHALKKAPFDVTATRVDTEAAFRAALADEPDLILSDYSLPQFDAERALDILRESGREIPFILVSGALGEETAIELMKHGIDDFLLKDRLARLPVAVTQALRNHQARQHRRQLVAEQQRLIDTLRERVKELTTLHRVSRILADESLSTADVLQHVATRLPAAMQYAEMAAARICLGDRCYASDGYRDSDRKLERGFGAAGEITTRIEIVYPELPPTADGPVFLDEERELLDTLAEMLHEWYAQRRSKREMAQAGESLRSLNEDLEARVRERTRALREREVFNRATLDTLSAHIAVLDADGRIVTTNRAWKDFARANGGDPARVDRGVDYLSVCGAAAAEGSVDGRRAGEAIQLVLAGELDDWSYEYLCPSRGENLWFLARAKPVIINHRRHVLVVHENITRMKRNEERLREARNSAEEASRAKSTFLMTMSHELRTPLNGVLGMNELLLMTDLDERQREYAEACAASGKHLLQLINDVLDLSRIETGKLQLQPERFALRELVQDIAATFAPLAREKGLALHHGFAEPLPDEIHGDRNRLQQVLINLVGNALKFTERGEIRVSVAPVTGEQGERGVRFTVSDTGIGIPETWRPKLFQAFSQVDSSTSRRYSGTGLGLSISRELVELMGGRIGLESEEGAGSTFWFDIPAELAPLPDAQPDAQPDA